MTNLWGVMWHEDSWLDGELEHLMRLNCMPVLFRTRREARAWVKRHYGYILKRPDLKAQPCGWMQPYPVKVKVEAL